MNLNVDFLENTEQIDIAFTDVTTIEGATFVPSVSEEGILSWSNDQGMPNPAPVNIMGQPGEDGKDGTSGYSVDASVKTVDGETSVTLYTVSPEGETGEIRGMFTVKDGKTPAKGIDYWTDADKQEMVEMVLAEMPVTPTYAGEVEVE